MSTSAVLAEVLACRSFVVQLVDGHGIGQQLSMMKAHGILNLIFVLLKLIFFGECVAIELKVEMIDLVLLLLIDLSEFLVFLSKVLDFFLRIVKIFFHVLQFLFSFL